MFKCEVIERLSRIEAKLDALATKGEAMSRELDDLQTQVRANTSAEQSAIVLLGRLGDLIRASADDPAKMRQLASDLDASKQALAAAVVTNTPAAP